MQNMVNTILDPEIRRNVERWLEGEYDEASKREIVRQLKEEPEKVLDAFYTTLSFGTGGLRGIVGVGSNRINRYTIGMVMQGIANYLKSLPQEHAKGPAKLAVLIGYDSRRDSREFAEIVAQIFSGNGIQVYLFRALRPTPLVSFGCRFKHAQAGIMITASHNTAEYNGCKIFWSDGAQVVSPHDKNIMDEVAKISDCDMVISQPNLQHPLIQEIDKEIDDAYIEMCSHMQIQREDNQQHGSDLKIVYTSLHGTGATIIPLVLKRWGFTNLQLVKSQSTPDATFSTVQSPNPEDPKALTLGTQQLQHCKGDLLIATDPDGDRVAVAVRHRGEVALLTGNQVAVLLLDHICSGLTRKNKMPANGAFIKSLMTTELFQAICDYYQKPCFNVLPGFKHVTEKIQHWEAQPRGYQFVFGAEESCGYLYGSFVRDKDAVQTSALIAEMALQAKLQDKTLVDLLNELYADFGFYYDLTVSLPFERSKKGFLEMAELMLQLRRMPPREIGMVPVEVVEDYQTSVRTSFFSHTHAPLPFAKVNMLIFRLVDGSKLIIRPSGTEPKIKVYCSIIKRGAFVDSAEESDAKAHALSLIDALVNTPT